MRKLPRAIVQSENPRTDPDYAPSVEVFDNLTHDEIHTRVGQLDPAALAGGRQAVSDSAAGLSEAIIQAHNEIRGAIADGWRGGAAGAAAEAVRAFEERGQQMADVLGEVARRLGQAGDAAEALRTAVGSPSAESPNFAAALLDPSQATGNIEVQKQNEHARQDAVRSMEDIYAGAFIPSGNGVPAFPDNPVAAADFPVHSTTPSSNPVAKDVPSQPDSFMSLPAPHATFSAPHTAPQPEVMATAAAAAPPTPAAPAAPLPQDTPAAPGTAPAATAPASSMTQASAHAAPTTPARHGVTPVASTVTPASTVPAPIPRTTAANANNPEQERKRNEQQAASHTVEATHPAGAPGGSDAAAGMGAGAVGGMMGGAFMAGDSPRQSSGVAAHTANSRPAHLDDEYDDDDFEFDLDDDEPTFLEPAPDGGELVGSLEPTTPPVLGDWTELE